MPTKTRPAINARAIKCELAQTDLWIFCRMVAPDFYTPDRIHLRLLCDTLQAAYERRIVRLTRDEAWRVLLPEEHAAFVAEHPEHSVCRNLMISMPPRHGKSRTLVNFTAWAFGRNQAERVITVSYNDIEAQDFSRYTRDLIAEEPTGADPERILYRDIFPEAQIKPGNAAMNKWALEGQFFSYKGAGLGGSLTGKGATIAIIDDPVKDAATAYNANALNGIWQWYTGTFISRPEEGALQVFNHTRWAKKDPSGRILDGDTADRWHVLSLKALQDDGSMLCPKILSHERYEELRDSAGETGRGIFLANYQQEPIDQYGRLYLDGFTSWEHLPQQTEGRLFYVDTADTGSDFLCALGGQVWNGRIYVTGIYYSQEPMEVTEPGIAAFINTECPRAATVYIESNSGGRGFARRVQELLRSTHRRVDVHVRWFHQSDNKESRIFTESGNAQRNVLMPPEWATRYPVFYDHLTEYNREGKNEFDDAPDAMTGLVEKLRQRFRVRREEREVNADIPA